MNKYNTMDWLKHFVIQKSDTGVNTNGLLMVAKYFHLDDKVLKAVTDDGKTGIKYEWYDNGNTKYIRYDRDGGDYGYGDSYNFNDSGEIVDITSYKEVAVPVTITDTDTYVYLETIYSWTKPQILAN